MNLLTKIDLLQYPFYTLIFSTQNNLPPYSFLPSLSYKSLSFLLPSVPKNTIVEVKEIYDIGSNVEMQPFSPNLLCKYYKKVLNISVKLKYSLEKEISMRNKNILLIFCVIVYENQERDFPTPI